MRATHKAGSEHTGEAGDGRVGPELEREVERKREHRQTERREVFLSIYLLQWTLTVGDVVLVATLGAAYGRASTPLNTQTQKNTFLGFTIGIGFLSPGGGLRFIFD